MTIDKVARDFARLDSQSRQVVLELIEALIRRQEVQQLQPLQRPDSQASDD